VSAPPLTMELIMTWATARVRWTRRATLLSLGIAVACGGGGDIAAPPPAAPRLQIASVLVEDPATGTFGKQGRAPDDHDMPPRNEWFTLAPHADHSLPVVIEDPTRARWEGDRLGGALTGQQAGASRLNIRVFRGTTTVWEAPPLNFIVR